MTTYKEYTRRVFAGTLLLILVFTGLFLLAGHRSWAKGVALGGAGSLVNLILMARQIPARVLRPQPGAGRRTAGQFTGRMAIMAGVLLYAAASNQVALGPTIAALFSAQAVLISGELTGRIDR